MNEYQVLQEWECYIAEINGDEITLHMKDLTDESNPEEIALIDMNKINIDPEQLGLGTILFWKIVHEKDQEPKSIFELYDKVFTEEDIRIASQKAEELTQFFKEVL